MPAIYAVRLTCSYEKMCESVDDCIPFIQYIQNHFETVLVYEHVGSVNEKVHCHLLLWDDVGVTSDAIKKSVPFKKLGLGNREHSFKQKFKCKRTKKVYEMTLENADRYITYMSKGEHDPKYWNGRIWNEDDLTKLKGEWKNVKSKTKILVESFAQYLGAQQPPLPSPGMPYDPYTWLKNKVWGYVMAKHDGFDGAAAAEFRMLLVTFMYHRGYIPTDNSKLYI